MRVIYSIGAKFAGGGIGTTAYHGVRGLHRHGMLHRLLCGSFRPTEIPREKIRALGLLSRVLRKLAVYDRSEWLRYLHNLLFDAWVSHYLERVDLFHVWNNYGLHSLRQAREMGMTTVVERGSSHPLYQTYLLEEEYARWGLTFHIPQAVLKHSLAELEMTDYVLIPSDFVRQSFLHYGFPEERLIQVSRGADVVRFCPSEQKTSHPFRVLFVGDLSIRKGLPYLLETWKRLGWLDAELWLVGRRHPEVNAVAKPYRFLPGLRLTGHVINPVALYRQADVFVFPSLEEGSAKVTFEAMASGLPVVTTHNAGSVVRDGIEGFIVPIRDIDALAAALEQLRADERLRREMSKAARARAEQFTWGRYEDHLTDVLRDIC